MVDMKVVGGGESYHGKDMIGRNGDGDGGWVRGEGSYSGDRRVHCSG